MNGLLVSRCEAGIKVVAMPLVDSDSLWRRVIQGLIRWNCESDAETVGEASTVVGLNSN